jgi:hypothetical protein
MEYSGTFSVCGQDSGRLANYDSDDCCSTRVSEDRAVHLRMKGGDRWTGYSECMIYSRPR